MPELPIRRMVIYKHGVGYFERRGAVSGTALPLSFPRDAMDDVLKSLVALDLGGGQVLGVDFETLEDRASRLARGSIHLSDAHSLLDLLRDLRGRQVRLHITNENTEVSAVAGTVVGVDLDERRPLEGPLVSLYLPEPREVRPLPVRAVTRVEVLDDRAADDLAYFLRASQSEQDRRAATLRLSEGEHDLLVGYVAPAPSWRVSYRVLFESDEGRGQKVEGETAPPSAFCLLQGWGLFDNQLEEDLRDVTLTLVAGMPVSFRYRLYEPNTPDRPLVEDETRTVAAPVEFGAMLPQSVPVPAAAAPPPMAAGMMRKRAMPTLGAADEPEFEMAAPMMSMDAAESSTVAAGVGEERGALFQYRVTHPVSVARGQSAMVPIVGSRLEARKELLYNAAKLPKHPVASLRMRNATGLTLERGPVTVVEEGDYAGEAVLPFTRDGAELIVPYAVELGISISETHGGERQMAGVSVRGEYLLVEEWDVRQVEYRLASTLARPAVVTVEQALLAHYAIHETAAPAEQTQGLARWQVACPAGVETRFLVRQRRRLARREQVRGLTGRQLQEYLRLRFLDETTVRALDRVLALYQQASQAQQRIAAIEQERQKIYKRQQQTQQSLGPLGREGEEGALRTRYVTLLGQLEDQLNAYGEEERRLQTEIARLEQEAAATLATLS
jgi:hypothetical protein